jgi:hypothetical protein
MAVAGLGVLTPKMSQSNGMTMTFEQVLQKQAEFMKSLESGSKTTASERQQDYDVVWSGGELLPDRPQTEDSRLNYVPSYDLDEGSEVSSSKPTRKYTKTGKHVGEFKKGPAKILQFPRKIDNDNSAG